MFCRAVLFGDVCSVQAADYRVLRVANSGHVAPPPLPPPVPTPPQPPSHTASLARRKRWEMKGVIHWGPYPSPPFRRVCGKIAFPKALITLPPRQFTNLLPRYFFTIGNMHVSFYSQAHGSYFIARCFGVEKWIGCELGVSVGNTPEHRTALVPPHPRAMRRTNELKTNRKPNLLWLSVPVVIRREPISCPLTRGWQYCSIRHDFRSRWNLKGLKSTTFDLKQLKTIFHWTLPRCIICRLL